MITGEEEDSIIEKMLLTEAISKLPPKQRAVVALISAGYTQNECGRIFGMTRAAIGFIHKKALSHLRRLIEELSNG
jgi:RNA polymerase sigma factor (sigma-70 family)